MKLHVADLWSSGRVARQTWQASGRGKVFQGRCRWEGLCWLYFGRCLLRWPFCSLQGAFHICSTASLELRAHLWSLL